MVYVGKAKSSGHVEILTNIIYMYIACMNAPAHPSIHHPSTRTSSMRTPSQSFTAVSSSNHPDSLRPSDSTPGVDKFGTKPLCRYKWRCASVRMSRSRGGRLHYVNQSTTQPTNQSTNQLIKRSNNFNQTHNTSKPTSIATSVLPRVSFSSSKALRSLL